MYIYLEGTSRILIFVLDALISMPERLVDKRTALAVTDGTGC
jgi:hypothetical protein